MTEMKASTAASRPSRETGLTLLELAIYVALLALLTVSILAVNVSMGRMSSEGSMLDRVLERNRIAFQRLEDDFRNSISGTALISNSGKTLRFVRHGGFNGTSTVSGDVLRYDVVSVPNGAANGLESALIRVNETKSQTVTLATGLEAGACSFTQSASAVNVTLSTVGKTSNSPVRTRMIRTLVLAPMN